LIEDEVAELNARYSKAVANQDVAGAVELYTHDARLMPPNAPMVQGHAEINQVLTGYIAMGVKSLDLDSVQVLTGDNDLVVDIGRFVLGIEAGADSIQDHGKYIVVLRRQPDGTLQMAADIFNSDEAPSAP
jgi:ketosteroid isomerase-like protein